MTQATFLLWLIVVGLTFLAALSVLLTITVVMIRRDVEHMDNRGATGWPHEGGRPVAGPEWIDIERRGGGSAPRSSQLGEQ